MVVKIGDAKFAFAFNAFVTSVATAFKPTAVTQASSSVLSVFSANEAVTSVAVAFHPTAVKRAS